MGRNLRFAVSGWGSRVLSLDCLGRNASAYHFVYPAVNTASDNLLERGYNRTLTPLWGCDVLIPYSRAHESSDCEGLGCMRVAWTVCGFERILLVNHYSQKGNRHFSLDPKPLLGPMGPWFTHCSCGPLQ